MLKKITFTSDSDVNAFFKENCNDRGENLIFLVKLIIIHNPILQRQEQHIIYSHKVIMKSGQHMRKGVI